MDSKCKVVIILYNVPRFSILEPKCDYPSLVTVKKGIHYEIGYECMPIN